MTQQSGPDPRKLVDLCTVDNAVEAQVLEGLLADRGIGSALMTWHSTPYDGIFENQKGHAVVRVYNEDLAAAEEVLADVREQAGSGGNEPATG